MVIYLMAFIRTSMIVCVLKYTKSQHRGKNTTPYLFTFLPLLPLAYLAKLAELYSMASDRWWANYA